jgi:hypothetical protein
MVEPEDRPSKWYNRIMDNKEEKCFYCNARATYNDLADEGTHFIVTGVCSKHVRNYVEGS